MFRIPHRMTELSGGTEPRQSCGMATAVASTGLAGDGSSEMQEASLPIRALQEFVDRYRSAVGATGGLRISVAREPVDSDVVFTITPLLYAASAGDCHAAAACFGRSMMSVGNLPPGQATHPFGGRRERAWKQLLQSSA
jgi:hypothetical protein